MRRFILCMYCWFVVHAALAASAQRPNIVLILADDLGYGDVQANNPDSKIATPHIDQLAREGMRFTDGHSASGVCTPTRYSLLTGRYPWRTHLQQGVLGGFSRPLIAPDRLTIAGLLKQQGYHTACFGKWHLGMDWPLRGGGVADDKGNFGQPFADAGRVDYLAPIQHGPLDRGFDHFFGIAASLDMFPYVWIHDRHATEVATTEKAFPRVGPAGATFEAIDVEPGIINHAIDYIAERAAAAKTGQPFFAYIPLAAPHAPIVPRPEWQGSSRINAYADFVQQVDADVGRLLTCLEQQGIAENTLVIFTSDNGCAPVANIEQLLAAGHHPSHIYRGHKADLYEGGHRVPFIIRWPGIVRAGSVSSQLVGHVDFMATFAQVIGVRFDSFESSADSLEIKLAPKLAEDSISFLSELTGSEVRNPRRTYVAQSSLGFFSIRDGDWKLAMCPGSGGWSDPKPGDPTERDLPPLQLYDLASDPGETKNLVAEHPNRVKVMKAKLNEIVKFGRSTTGPVLRNDVDVVILK